MGALLSIWIVAFQTYTYEARIAFVGVPALATLAGLGVQRWRPPLRFLLPGLVTVDAERSSPRAIPLIE